MLSSYILLFLSVSPVTGYTCEKTAKICETSLSIKHYLTMFNRDTLAVYPQKGKLYKYDVTNTSNADPVPKENIITGDGWEVRKLLVVANQSLPGPDIIVYEGQTVIIHVKNPLTFRFSDDPLAWSKPIWNSLHGRSPLCISVSYRIGENVYIPI